jgi:DNA-directed RNA polymerase specialized sigma24 family protein
MAQIRADFTEGTWEAFLRQVRDGQPARTVAKELEMSVNAALIAKSRVLRRLRAEVTELLD